jgi:hypothetical protein
MEIHTNVRSLVYAGAARNCGIQIAARLHCIHWLRCTKSLGATAGETPAIPGYFSNMQTSGGYGAFTKNMAASVYAAFKILYLMNRTQSSGGGDLVVLFHRYNKGIYAAPITLIHAIPWLDLSGFRFHIISLISAIYVL